MKAQPKQKFIEKCFTVRQPWAHLIMSGRKNVENRGVKTNYRGRVGVHASATMDAHDKANVRRHKLDPDKLPKGVLLGTVELYDCVENSKSRWVDDSKWHWLLRNPKPFKKHKKMNGWLNLYPLKRRIRIN
jgi:ASCH domain-containing protein